MMSPLMVGAVILIVSFSLRKSRGPRDDNEERE